LINFFKY